MSVCNLESILNSPKNQYFIDLNLNFSDNFPLILNFIQNIDNL